MRSRILHVLHWAVIAAAFAGISTLAQAKIYPIGWDPTFGGDVKVDLVNDAACRAQSDGQYPGGVSDTCQLDLVVVDVFALSAPSIHYTTSVSLPITGVASLVEIIGGFFVQFETGVIPLIQIGCFEGCSSATIDFDIGGVSNEPFPGHAVLTVTPFLGDPIPFVNSFAVPEPGTLGLLLGAFGAGWLARRRKAKA